MDKIAVLIPCYNEAATIGNVVSDFKESLPDAAIYVYDNNSVDDTVKMAKEAGAIVRHEYKQGKGNVIRRMFREIEAHCYILADGDNTYPAEYAPQMASYVLEKNADMVIGDRLSSTYFTENKRPFHNIGNRVVRNLINSIFKCGYKDIMSGYRALSYSYVKSFPVLSKGFEIETEMSIHAAYHNMSCENVVIDYRDRPEGSVSKLNTVTDGVKVLRKILILYKNYKPLHFFSLIAAVFILAAAALFIPVFVEYLDTGLVPRFPTLILCGFLTLAGIHSFFGGLNLDVLKQKNLQDHEMVLQEIEFRKKHHVSPKARNPGEGN